MCVRGFKGIGKRRYEGAGQGAAQLLERFPETIAGYLPRGDDTGGEGKRKVRSGILVIAHPTDAHGRKCTRGFQLNEILAADPIRLRRLESTSHTTSFGP